MVQTLATNGTNDIYRGADGNIVMAIGVQAVLAACATAAKAQLGEMVLAQNQGIPNFQTIWKGAPNYAIFASYLRRALLAVKGVSEVKDLTLAMNNNILSYTATILTIYGKGALNG